jgi:cytochrome c553
VILLPTILMLLPCAPPPVVAARCVSCHGPAKQRGGLRLDSDSRAIAGGDSGAALVPGKPDGSAILRRVASAGDDRMPPSGEPLTSSEIQQLNQWISMLKPGAPSDDSRPHWAFTPPARPPVPASAFASPAANPVDSFIHAKLKASGLAPSPRADKAALLRRLHLDLTGLPPTPEEADTFIRDSDPKAYEKRVDRLLASPRHAERWARHWLDTVRFAESHGFEMNQARPNAWPYRDWVIRSLWEDKPYDRFVMEQVAGDRLGAPEATGFLVGGPWDQVKSPDPGLTAQQRADELADMAGTLGSAFLGLTLGCARCHGHKFDPITQADYHAITATLAGTRHGEMALPASASDLPGLEAIKRERQAIETSLAPLQSRLRPSVTHTLNTEPLGPVTARFIRMTITAAGGAQPCLDEFEVIDAAGNNAARGARVSVSGTLPGFSIHQAAHLTDGRYGNDHSWISDSRDSGWLMVDLGKPVEIKEARWSRDRGGEEQVFTDRVPTVYSIEVSNDGAAWKCSGGSANRLPKGRKVLNLKAGPPLSEAETALLSEAQAKMADLDAREKKLSGGAKAYAGTFAEPGPQRRFHRGDPTQPREEVPPGTIRGLGRGGPFPPGLPEPERRLALARWIASPANPLTARVIVNRIWQHHFGEGIVATPSDFGRNGAAPSHPELLDWLASELVANNWSLRSVHRLIVTSDTYCQSGAIRPEAMAKDAGNKLLWRFAPRRLEAEAIRDGILAACGNLDLAMYGPGFDLFEPNTNYVKVYIPRKTFGPPQWRRMVYQAKPRMQLDDIFGAFDCPDAGQIAPRRSRSITPLQALALLNSPFMEQQAGIMAGRLQREAADDGARVDLLFRLVNGRLPDAEEKSGALALVADAGLPALCRAVLNSSEWLFIR